jgi:hypothetical protein
MEGQVSSNLTIYLMLILSCLLVYVDVLELNNLLLAWNKELTLSPKIFDSCVKWELMTKFSFCVFSLMSALSASCMTFFLIINEDIFLEKILTTYLYFNYTIFGPIMLGFSILALVNWDKTLWICDKRDFTHKFFSISNLVSLIGTTFISLIITLTISIYQTVNLYIDSTLRKPGSSDILRKMFWYAVLKNRSASEIMRQANPTNEQNRTQ